MATTTNYGWTTPDDTALVKDGASAIRTLGTSIDTTTKALNPSTTLGDIEYRSSTANTNTRLPLGTANQVLRVNSGATAPEWATVATGMTNPLTTTGDTIYSSSGTTPARLGIGTTGQVLTVASGLPSWATATGGMTLISTTTLTGASVTISSIPATYVNLFLVFRQFLPATDSGKLNMRLNADSASRYRVITSTGDTASGTFNGTEMQISNSVDNATTQFSGTVLLADYANTTTWKVADIFSTGNDPTTTTSLGARWTKHVYNQTGAISSIQFLADTGNMTSGTVLLYGVK